MPDIQISFIAIAIAVAAHFFLGFIWFSYLFGRAWAKEMGMDFDAKPDQAVMFKSMAINLVGNFLLAWVFMHNLAVWDPATWGLAVASDYNYIAHACTGAVFTWLGFFVPMLLNDVAWGKHSWKLFSINAAYHLVSLLLVANILVNFSKL